MPKRDMHRVLFPKQRKVLATFGQDLLIACKRTGFDNKTINKVFAGDPSVAIGTYLKVLSVLGMEENFAELAAFDEVGVKLQKYKTVERLKMSQPIVDVYGSWIPLEKPLVIGQLNFAETSRGGVFSFAYVEHFLQSDYRLQIDSLLTLHSGTLYNDSTDKNFRAFLDSSPDRWGRILMQRRAAIEHKRGRRSTARLTELDQLLGVHDSYRTGGIRFRTSDLNEFLDNNTELAAPPMTSLHELEYAAMRIEQEDDIDSEAYYRWLKMLISPGSSLDGARPKACVTDTDNNLWIAKFPNQNDTIDVGAWEMLCHQLAIAAGVDMFPSECRKLTSEHHTFLTKRFDRVGNKRIHFSSSMTQLQYYDGELAERCESTRD